MCRLISVCFIAYNTVLCMLCYDNQQTLIFWRHCIFILINYIGRIKIKSLVKKKNIVMSVVLVLQHAVHCMTYIIAIVGYQRVCAFFPPSFLAFLFFLLDDDHCSWIFFSWELLSFFVPVSMASGSPGGELAGSQLAGWTSSVSGAAWSLINIILVSYSRACAVGASWVWNRSNSCLFS